MTVDRRAEQRLKRREIAQIEREEREARVVAYCDEYDAITVSGELTWHWDVGVWRPSVEDRFRVSCFNKVWSHIRFAETDRLIQFAKALMVTSDLNLRLDDPIMGKAFDEYKGWKRGPRPTRRLTPALEPECKYRDKEGKPCPVEGCNGKMGKRYYRCMDCMRKQWTIASRRRKLKHKDLIKDRPKLKL